MKSEQPVRHAVLIPAYRPPASLVDLVRELSAAVCRPSSW